MSINSINFGFSPMSFEQASNLTQKTRQTLIALGIDPKSVASEEEALALISKILSQRVQLAKTSKNKGGCAEAEIILKAKSLASYVGIVLPESVPVDKILDMLSNKIESLSKENPQGADIDNAKNELSELKEMYKSLKQKEDNMFASLDYNANINKIIMGL